MGLIADLKQSREQGKTAIYILGTYGIQDEAELKTPLNQLRPEQAMDQVLNWIVWKMKKEEGIKIRLFDNEECSVYEMKIRKNITGRMLINRIRERPELKGKILHMWGDRITYEMLLIQAIKSSIICADSVNDFNEDMLCEECRSKTLTVETCTHSSEMKSQV